MGSQTQPLIDGDDAMAAPMENLRGNRGFGSTTMAAGMLVGLLVLYVLSPLPVLLLASYSEHSMPWLSQLLETLWVIYAPLEWLAGSVPFVERFYDWYLQPVYSLIRRS